MFASEHNWRHYSLLIVAAVYMILGRARVVDAAAEPQPLRILVVRAAEHSPPDTAEQQLLNGITLGIEEARQTAGMFGFVVLAETVRMDELEVRLRTAPTSARYSAVLGGWATDQCRQFSGAAQAVGALYMNAGCTDDTLRAENCRTTLHVAPSEAMRANALRAISERDSTRTAEKTTMRVAGWHPSLERFGAGQLSDRYRARYKGEDMTELAWNGWFAVKALTEAFLRSGASDSRSLAGFLASDRARLDGHKGVPLSFRARDHQLRQPLYVVRTGGAVNEVLPQPDNADLSPACR